MDAGTSRRGETRPGETVLALDMVPQSSCGHHDVMTQDNQWWYCLKHNAVEQGGGCGNTERLGPYASSEEASRALQKAAERTEEWDNDPKWNDD